MVVLFRFHLQTASMHCFNTNCHGFIITYPDIPLDYVFESTSTCGGPTYITEFHIRQGFDIGIWEIQLSNDTVLGFFGPGVFKEMEEFGTYVEWGGQVYSPPNTALPQMGSGHGRPSYWEWDGNYDAYCIYIKVLNQNGQLEDAYLSMEAYADMHKIYGLEDGGVRNDTGRLLFFGGMGNIPNDNPC